MQNTIVYLIRHSEQLKIDGVKNIEEDEQINNEKTILSVEGENKARELSKREELNNIDVIWSSNYVRAISTAKYIANENNIPINIDINLNDKYEFERLEVYINNLDYLGQDRDRKILDIISTLEEDYEIPNNSIIITEEAN